MKQFKGKQFTAGRNQGGFTMIELAIAISVFVIAAVLVYQNWGPISAMWKGSREAQNMVSVTQSVGNLSNQGSFGTGNLLGALSGEQPGTMSMTGAGAAATLTNAFGGTVTVTGQGASAEFVTTNEPDSVCRRIVSGLNQSFKDRATIKTDSQTFNQGTVILASQLGDACTGNSNTITWDLLPN